MTEKQTDQKQYQYNEQYSRTRRLLGQPALDTLAGAHVAVFGLGGVGGHAAEALARSGVGELTLVDNDTVALSNLNRQLVALHSTLGQDKTLVMAQRIAQIDPAIKVHPLKMFYSPETADEMDMSAFDYVVDCIDTVTAKLLLITKCKAADTPILCCMGTANKLDPTALRVSDISKTSVCPLAKVMRIECRKRGLGPVQVIWSDELPLTPLPDAAAPEQPAPGRNAVPASCTFVPASAGLLAGSTVVQALLRKAGTLRTAKA